MHIKSRYFSQKNLATGGWNPHQMPLTVKGGNNHNLMHAWRKGVDTVYKNKEILKYVPFD